MIRKVDHLFAVISIIGFSLFLHVTFMRKTTTLLTLCWCCSLIGTVVAAPNDPQPSITVMGTGEVLEKPDMARVNIGVVTQLETASASLRQNTEAVEKVLATLNKFKIAEADIQTSNFSIGPQYDYNRSGQPPRLVGYRVTNQVRIAVRNIEDLGALLDELVSAGSNQINDVRFDIDEVAAHEDTARRMAVSDARRKATLYAQEAGVQLGSVIKVEEMSGPVVMPQMGMQMAAEARAVPIAPGRQTVRQQVRVTFAIEAEQ
jgi:uncharacterized protein YggE